MNVKNLFLSIVIGFSAVGIEAVAQNTTVAVNVKGVKDGTKLTMKVAGTYKQEEPVQTVEVKNGKAVFAFDAEEPRGYRLAVEGNSGEIIVLDKGEKAEVSAVAEERQNNSGQTYVVLNDFMVKGSATHDWYLSQRPDRKVVDEAYEKMYKENEAFIEKLRATPGRDSEEYKALVNSQEYKQYAQRQDEVAQMHANMIRTAVETNRDNWMGAFIIASSHWYLTEREMPLYEALSDKIKDSFYGKIIGNKLVPISLSEPLPDFEFTDHSTGKSLRLHEICKQNKYVLIDFWASWCGPCRKEIPNFKAQYELYKGKGFQIVSISADQSEAAWLKALDEENLPWYNDRDGEKGISKLYNVQFYPTVYLLDSQARAVASNNAVRGEALRTKLAELFK